MSAWDVTREEIELVCAYIGDDQTVANYFGISRHRVEHIRATMRETAGFRFKSTRNEGGASSSSGEVIQRVAEENARAGSVRLNEAIQRLFRKWEQQHGFKYGAAEILLPAGYNPEHAIAA